MSSEALRKQADAWLSRGPYSVVHKPERPAGDDPHDYVSLSLHAWPADGGYAIRDGHPNPESHGENFDRARLRDMIDGVKALSVGLTLFGDARYGERAAELLRVWFLDSATRMNPHLSHAQIIPGRESTGGGIIDTYELWSMLDAVDLLIEGAFLDSDEVAALQRWFGALVTWLGEHPMGIAEREKTNNHGTSYDVQVIRYRVFAGEIAPARDILERAIEDRLERQILPDGTQPREATRSRSLHYHWYNLTKMCHLAELGARLNVDFLRHKDLLRGAIEYLLPFVDHPERWPLQEHADVAPYNILEPVFIGMQVFDLPQGRDVWERHFGQRSERQIFPVLPYRTLLGGHPALTAG